MKLKLLILSTVLGIVFGLSGFLRADPTVTQVTNNSYQDTYPQINGHYLVWQAHVDSDWEIFLYNIATGETTQLTENDYDDTSPKTDGNYIVWQGLYYGEWDVFLWDGNEMQAISDRGAEDVSPQISNGLIVWTSHPFGDDFVGSEEVILYDTGSGTHITLSNLVDPGNALDDSAPRINDGVVTWVQADDQNNTTLYMYELRNGTITENPDYVGSNKSQRDGNLRALTRHDGRDREILVYNSDAGKYDQITNNSINDTCPSTSGNYVAWMGGEGDNREIFFATYAIFEDGETGMDTSTGHTGEDTTSGDSGGDGGNGDGGWSCFVDTVASSLSW